MTQQHEDKWGHSSSKCQAPGNGQRQLPVPKAANTLLNLRAESPALKGQRRCEMEVALFSF